MNGEIPLIRAGGGYRDVGRQIGEACAQTLRAAADLASAGVPRHGRTLGELLDAAARCRDTTAQAFPWIVEELDGAAEAAGADAALLFAASVEELWESPPSQPAGPDRGEGQAGRTQGRCTDVLAAPAATSSGRLLVAHNNDLSAGSERDVVAVERDIPGDPVIFSIGIGPWISVGWNSAGLSLTGNEVSPTDERVGIPRLLLVRAQLRARTLGEAAALGVHPLRASAYNSVLADARGQAVNLEASATDHERWGPDGRGAIVHTNHYVSGRMAAYEADPAYAARSARRFARAGELLAALPPGAVDEQALLDILADHRNGQDAICRHPADGADAGATKTVFWCLADVTAGRVRYGPGNPCRSTAQTARSYAFEPASYGRSADGQRARPPGADG